MVHAFLPHNGTAVIMVVGYLVLSPSSGSTPRPIYEEAHSLSSDLHMEIGRIDIAIYDCFYRGNIPDKDIIFTRVEPRSMDGYFWDFTELSILLHDAETLLFLKGLLESELSRFFPEVHIETDHVSELETVFRIHALDFLTHQVRLLREGHPVIRLETLPKVAIIIDDLGYDLELAKAFMELGIPLSLSILPVAPYTEAIVFEAKKRDCELLLHLPMEPKNFPSLDPGPGALLVGMDDHEIRDITEHHLEQIPGVRGVNNHMGSCFTEKKDKMRVVLSELKKRNLFFIDSTTTGQSVGYRLAKDMAIPAAKRNIFLDNDLKRKAIGLQLERLLGIAKHSGRAIGIGHPNEETLATLRRYLPRLAHDIQLVHASKLVE